MQLMLKRATLVGVAVAIALYALYAETSSKAMPDASIPTFSTEDIARTGFFYAGGKYAGDKGKEVMGGAMYEMSLLSPSKMVV